MNSWFVASVQAPHQTDGKYQGWTPCGEWCKDTFNDALSEANWRYVGEGVFEFERESDRTAFLLRWG